MLTVALAAVVAAATVAIALVSDQWFSRVGSDLASQTRTVAPGLVGLEAPEGRQLLFESEAHEAFFPLISHFETQKSTAHCGPASIVMVLNALAVRAPKAFGSYRLFTQDNVFDPLTEPITSDRTVAKRGMALIEVAAVLRAYGLSVDVRYADQSSANAFRSSAAEYLRQPASHVIVNYSRTALGQDGPGHISPLGAYDADSDRFLILDVSRYKAPAVWVLAEQLFAAMAEPIGPDEGTRGYLLIRAPANGGSTQ
jgi:glutathione-S-conjugate glycine hydrolase